jgi:hypothetical protein
MVGETQANWRNETSRLFYLDGPILILFGESGRYQEIDPFVTIV